MGSYRDWLALDRAMNAPERGLTVANPDIERRVRNRGIDNPNIRSASVGSVFDVVFPGQSIVDSVFLQREINSLNQSVETFRHEVNARLTQGGKDIGALISFAVGSLADFYGRWQAFYQDHQSVVKEFYNSTDIGEALAVFKAEYISLRSEWVDGLHQKTSAPSGKPKAFPMWTIPVGLAALAIIFVGPALAPILAGALAKKAAAKALVMA